MPDYFVCEQGPMGGCSIVWVGESIVAALKWIEIQPKTRELFVYKLIVSGNA